MAFTDDFTGTDGQVLEDRTGWTRVSSDDSRLIAEIQSNGLTYSATGGVSPSGQTVFSCTDQGSADHTTEVLRKKFPDRDNYLCIRLVDGDNWIGHHYFGTGSIGSRVVENVAGSRTDIITTQGADEDVITVEGDGNTIRLYENGVEVGSATTSSHNTETTQGLVFEEATVDTIFDNFEAAALGGGGTALSATIASSSAVSAEIQRTLGLDSTVASVSDVAAELQRTLGFAASVDSVSALSAELSISGAVALSATLSSASGLTAELRRTRGFDSSIASASALSAELRRTLGFDSTLANVSALSAELTVVPAGAVPLSATIVASSAVSVDLRRTIGFAADVAASSAISGEIQRTLGLSMTLAAGSALTAGLSGGAAAWTPQAAVTDVWSAEGGVSDTWNGETPL